MFGVFSTNNFILNVPFSEKEEAKKLGAIYSVEDKSWIVPNHLKNDIFTFSKWIPKNKFKKAFLIHSVQKIKNKFLNS